MGLHPWGSTRRVLIALTLITGIGVLVPSTVSAQAVTGTLLGNVTDSTGAAVPGATVTATETRTNVSRTAVANETGYYLFTSLQNGIYTVEAELQGFKKVVREAVPVDVNTTIRVDLRLEVGQLTETVSVSAETPLLQTDRTDTGRIIESKMIAELPLTFNRNFQSLMQTVPGVSRPHREHSQFFNSQDSLRFEVNGQPGMASTTLIEGLDDNHKTGLLQVIIPAADALETVAVTTSNYDAEFGRAGGAVTNVTIKSGTNEFRGSAFVFANNESTNASDYFTHLKAPTSFFNGGFTMGGPIVKNKLFFFGDYQRTLDNGGYVVRATIPTMAMRNGDFSAVTHGIYDPFTGDINGNGRTRFANNQIPQERISPIARRLLAFIPEPNTAAALGQTNFSQAAQREKTTDGFDVKVNHAVTRPGSDVVSPQLHAAGRVRPGRVRRIRRSGQRRLRRHRHQRQLQQRGDLDPRHQRQDRARCPRRPELLPQHHVDDRTGPDDQHGRRHSRREPQRLHQRHLDASTSTATPGRCSASRPASPGIAGRRPGTAPRR